MTVELADLQTAGVTFLADRVTAQSRWLRICARSALEGLDPVERITFLQELLVEFSDDVVAGAPPPG